MVVGNCTVMGWICFNNTGCICFTYHKRDDVMSMFSPYVEQRMFTNCEQISSVSLNETRNGLILTTQEIEIEKSSARLYLTPEEAIELSNILLSMVDKLKKNSL